MEVTSTPSSYQFTSQDEDLKWSRLMAEQISDAQDDIHVLAVSLGVSDENYVASSLLDIDYQIVTKKMSEWPNVINNAYMTILIWKEDQDL